jgi:hypothetical protein
MHDPSDTTDGLASTRRAVLGGMAAAALGASAGCLGGSTPPLEPSVPTDRLEADGWHHAEDVDESFTEEVTVKGVTQTVHADTKTDVYRNDGPAVAAAESLGVDPAALGASAGDDAGNTTNTAGGAGGGSATSDSEFRLPPAQFLASKARTDPPVAQLLGLSETVLSRVLDQAESRAMAQLREAGFENVRRVASDTLDIDAAGEARHRRYAADYPHPSTTVPYGGREVTVESGTFAVEAQLAVWPYDGLLAAAGGAYPGEEGSLTLSAAGTTSEQSLGLRPEHYRESVRALTTLVS